MKRQDIKLPLLFSSILLTFTILGIYPICAAASTWYIRTDGGTSSQCTGLVDAAYPGNGTLQACAFNHPFWLLKPDGTSGLSGTATLQGGDTAIISAGSYLMGIGAPNTSACSSSWAYDCTLPPIPSGPDASHPTKIYGKNWDTKSTVKPELWGFGRANRVLNLTGSNNIDIRYLEVTDHSACIFNSPDPSKRCDDGAPYNKPTARTGIYAADSTNVFLKDLNIHGLSSTGIRAGRIKDWTLDGVIIRANGFVGWDGDIGHGSLGSGTESSNSGNIIFRNSKIEYSGCGEQYPGTAIYGCFSQDQGGYGDGLGTYFTGGNWIFENSEISHNVSDGLDLLYHGGPSMGTITIKNSRFEGNAGQQVKVNTTADIINSIIIGNCDYFYHNPIAEQGGNQSYVNQAGFNSCRANGTALVTGNWGANINTGIGVNRFTIVNSILTGPSTILIETSGSSCDGTEQFISRNNIFLGMENWHKKTHGEPGIYPDLFYLSGNDGNGNGPCGTGTTRLKFDNKDSIAYSLKYNQCPNSNNVLCVDPKLPSIPPLSNANDIYTYGDRWNVAPLAGSPAIDQASSAVGMTILGNIVVPATDIEGKNRPYGSGIDWGPYEYQPDTTPPSTQTSGASSGSGGGCFIATAAYGSYLHPHVQLLRNFRDNYLITNCPGRAFVALYYNLSPPIADFIAQYNSLRLIARLLLTPIVFVVAHPGASLMIAMMLFGCLFIRRKQQNPFTWMDRINKINH